MTHEKYIPTYIPIWEHSNNDITRVFPNWYIYICGNVLFVGHIDHSGSVFQKLLTICF